MPEPTHAAIFDLDGTLIDTYDAHHAAWRTACAANGIELTPAMLGMNLGGMNHGVEPTLFFQKKDHLRSPTIDPNTWSLNTL